MAKRARDFFQSLADLMKGYLSDSEEDVKELPKKSKKSKKKAPELSSTKSKKAAPSKKVNRDPDAPKKPLPAFLLYSNNKRREMKEKSVGKNYTLCLDMALNDRLQLIQTEWSRMSKVEKDVLPAN